MFRSNRRWYFPSRFYSTVILVLRSIWIPMADVQEGVPMFRFSKLQSWIPMQLTRAFQVSLQLLFLLILSQKDKMTRVMRQKLGQGKRGPARFKNREESWTGEVAKVAAAKQRSKGIWEIHVFPPNILVKTYFPSIYWSKHISPPIYWSKHISPQYIGQNWWPLSVEGTANASQIRQIVAPHPGGNYGIIVILRLAHTGPFPSPDSSPMASQWFLNGHQVATNSIELTVLNWSSFLTGQYGGYPCNTHSDDNLSLHPYRCYWSIPIWSQLPWKYFSPPFQLTICKYATLLSVLSNLPGLESRAWNVRW